MPIFILWLSLMFVPLAIGIACEHLYPPVVREVIVEDVRVLQRPDATTRTTITGAVVGFFLLGPLGAAAGAVLGSDAGGTVERCQWTGRDANGQVTVIENGPGQNRQLCSLLRRGDKLKVFQVDGWWHVQSGYPG